jgi:hypothetical protein
VPEDVIHSWVCGLPKADVVHIVSLLGWKKSGYSEFGYYPFRSSTEQESKPTFQEWLNVRYHARFVVHEFPMDASGIPMDVLRGAKRLVLGLLESGCTTIVIDSAGAERTARVCEATGYQVVST